jgi:hypothetical protein
MRRSSDNRYLLAGTADRHPDALGWAVSWADPEPAPVWLDAARDFSEYWTHHQQICDATDQAGLMNPGYAGPVIDTFMRALPHTLRNVTAPEGTALQIVSIVWSPPSP